MSPHFYDQLGTRSYLVHKRQQFIPNIITFQNNSMQCPRKITDTILHTDLFLPHTSSESKSIRKKSITGSSSLSHGLMESPYVIPMPCKKPQVQFEQFSTLFCPYHALCSFPEMPFYWQWLPRRHSNMVLSHSKPMYTDQLTCLEVQTHLPSSREPERDIRPRPRTQPLLLGRPCTAPSV